MPLMTYAEEIPKDGPKHQVSNDPMDYQSSYYHTHAIFDERTYSSMCIIIEINMLREIRYITSILQ